MGVDAKMFVRIRGRDNWLRKEDELSTSYDLSSTIGCDKFLITKGSEFKRSQHHALEIMQPIKDDSDASDR